MDYNGLELYRGPSVLNGDPVVALLTLHSGNDKTGDMCQVWILRADMHPQEAVATGADEAMCGHCDQRHFLEGACYVNITRQGPARVWQAWMNGRYPVATRRHIKRLTGRGVRLGAYGDPAAVPDRVWRPIVKVAGFTTGYTHQAHHPNFDPAVLDYCMVSADNVSASRYHQAIGRRTFRVKTEGQPVLAGETYCPADREKDVQCLDCGMCSGANAKGPNIVIDVHGSRAKRFERIACEQITCKTEQEQCSRCSA